MGCPAEVFIGDNLVFSVTTHDPDTGVLTDADAVPSYRVYEDETAAAILTGTMAKLDDGNTTGFYTESIACTTENGFEDGKTYTIYIAATVDSDTGGICYGFKARAKLGEIVEGTYDVKEALRLLLAFCVGKASGGGTAAPTFRDTADAKDRIIMTVDANGNRTAVTLDVTD